ncbi:MAG: hypothetical protein GY941_22350 [Planctomycetes bacterium]|nr:hypothetical protein [Planctomycetota bacterium]
MWICVYTTSYESGKWTMDEYEICENSEEARTKYEKVIDNESTVAASYHEITNGESTNLR